MDAQSPFRSFPAVPVGRRRQDVTSPLSVIPFLSFLSSFPFLFSLFSPPFFFFTNPRGERKGRVALKERRFFFSGTNAGTLAELNESATGHAPVPPEVTCLTADP